MLQASLPLAVRERVVPARQVALALALGAAAGLGVAAADSTALTVAVAGGVALAGLGLYRPAAFVALLMLARPMLDEATKTSVGPTNPPGVLGLALVGLAAILVFTRPRALKPPAAVAFLIVVLVTGLGVIIAKANFGSVVGNKPTAEVVRLAALVAVYVLAANLFGSAVGVRRMFLIVALSGVGPAVWACYELISGNYSGGVDTAVDLHRVSGPFVGPVPLGMFLAISAILLIAMPRGWLALPWRLVALAPILTATVASYSRSGWAAFLIAFIIISLWGNKWLLPAGVTLIVGVLVAVPPVADRVLPQKNHTTEERQFGSYSFRIDNWRDLLEQAQERPLFGYGANTTNFVNVRRPFSSDIADPGGGYDAHNAGVRLAVEGGIVLLLAWIGFLVVVGRTLRPLISRIDPLSRPARIVAGLWVAFVLVGLTSDDPTGVTTIMFALFALTGALEGAGSRRQVPAFVPPPKEAVERAESLPAPPPDLRKTAHA